MKFTLSFLCLLLTPVCMLAQSRYDVVIDEIMADPSPQVNLPNNEWVELRNTSNTTINLQNWRIGDLSGQSGPMPNFILAPDSSVIVCTGSAVSALSAFGRTIAVTSFPSLDNDGDQLFLKAANGMTVHAVNYSSSWYQNELKKEGGWTLEMIDTKSACAGKSNWKASINTNGGTPGKINSVDAMNADITAPVLLNAYTTDATTIVLVFNEPVDSLSGATLVNYSIDRGLVLSSAQTSPPLFNQVVLKTISPLLSNTIYTVTANNVMDCSSNMIRSSTIVKTGLPVDPVSGDWIINEILFNPRSGAYDYVEFYNNSSKIVDASKLYIANRNSSGSISSIKPLSTIPFYLFPGDYIVATEDPDNLARQYLVPFAERIVQVTSPPSFPDDEGTVIALNSQGEVIDEVTYKDDWHFKLIDNDEGVSLERIDPNGESQNATNWHSAASTAGFGTPGYKNSQYKLLQTVNATIAILPKVFSPDNDGRDDITTLQYEIEEPGFVANITIYDAAGKPVRNLVRIGTLGLKGYWNWDGLDDKGNKLPIGTYIIYSELFNLQGKKQQWKHPVVIARNLR